jgi:hypothetical protein
MELAFRTVTGRLAQYTARRRYADTALCDEID